MPKPKFGSAKRPKTPPKAAPPVASTAASSKPANWRADLPDAFRFQIRGLSLPMPGGPRSLDLILFLRFFVAITCWIYTYFHKHGMRKYRKIKLSIWIRLYASYFSSNILRSEARGFVDDH